MSLGLIDLDLVGMGVTTVVTWGRGRSMTSGSVRTGSQTFLCGAPRLAGTLAPPARPTDAMGRRGFDATPTGTFGTFQRVRFNTVSDIREGGGMR
jgi:hypothetical protein